MRLIIILTSILSFYSFAQDSISVLFIGNSYTYYNDLPGLVDSLAMNSGKIILYGSQTAGGATLSTHAGSANTYTAINFKPWDYVVLQAQSQEPSFPDNQVNTQTIPYAIQLADSVYSNKFCSEVTMFMTWGRENGDPQWAPISTYDGMQNRLRNAYMRMADSVEGSVAPVGMAWKYTRENYPTIDLYQVDESHPSYAGSYLAACTFYATFYRESPIGNPFYGNLDVTTATNLQTAAHIAVLDSLEQWNIRPLEEHTQANFQYTANGLTVDFENLSTKAQSYEWSFGDGTVSAEENPQHTYLSSGIYLVELVAASPCDLDTTELQIVVNNVGITELNPNKINWYIDNNYQLTFVGLNGFGTIRLHDMTGKVIYQSENSTEVVKLPIEQFSKGNYIVTYQIEGELLITRISF